jgi:hypothetical protein
MRVKIDGKRVSLPYIKLGALSVMKDGYRVVLRTHEGTKFFVIFYFIFLIITGQNNIKLSINTSIPSQQEVLKLMSTAF